MRLGRDAGRRNLVIDTPAHVLRPRLSAIAPPGVLVGAGVDQSENVDQTDFFEYPRQPGALLGQKARILLVALPVAQVDFLVRDVPVAADHDFLSAPRELDQ